jgi:hypothetical protein
VKVPFSSYIFFDLKKVTEKGEKKRDIKEGRYKKKDIENTI